jgi:outer membrane protein assembly factor BamB
VVKAKPIVMDGVMYTTVASRISGGKVIIGNGGAEFGARGYITAYRADTGEEAWRFHELCDELL